MYRRLLQARRRMMAPLVWIDCEMTGLNTKRDKIMEISCFVTDGKLNLLEPGGFTRVLSVPQPLLDGMDSWCTKTHGESGLTAKVQNSTLTAEVCETELMAYLMPLVAPKKGVLAGNSVHADKMFLMNEFPTLVDFLHYRMVDVSSIKELGMRHNPKLMMKLPPKKMKHTAREDILESIEELRWYYQNYLRPPTD